MDMWQTTNFLYVCYIYTFQTLIITKKSACRATNEQRKREGIRIHSLKLVLFCLNLLSLLLYANFLILDTSIHALQREL